jgi:hypothetical protein
MRPRCCVLVAVSPADGGAEGGTDGGGTVGVGAGVGGRASGARSGWAQPNSSATASPTARYDGGRNRGPRADIADSCTVNAQLYIDATATTE